MCCEAGRRVWGWRCEGRIGNAGGILGGGGGVRALGWCGF